jgi:hypothetical protein
MAPHGLVRLVLGWLGKARRGLLRWGKEDPVECRLGSHRVVSPTRREAGWINDSHRLPLVVDAHVAVPTAAKARGLASDLVTRWGVSEAPRLRFQAAPV